MCARALHCGGDAVPSHPAVFPCRLFIAGIAGATEEEQYAADTISEVSEDFRVALFKTLFGDHKEAEAIKFRETTAPRKLRELSTFLEHSGGPYVAGATFTFGDLELFDALTQTELILPGCLDAHPLLKAFVATVAARPNIAAYLARGPRKPAHF